MQRFINNPILSPNSENPWEAVAAFNGSVVKDDSTVHLMYRAMSGDQKINGKNLKLSVIGHAMSTDGITFSDRSLFLKPEAAWETYGCEDPRITKIDDEYFVFYTGLSDFPPYPSAIKICVAHFKDFNGPIERHLVTPFNSKAMVLFPDKINGKYVALLTVNTDIPPAKICIAWFDTKEEIWSQLFWRRWYQSLDLHTLPVQRLNTDQIEVGTVPIKTEYGWLFIYAHIKNYFTENKRIFGIEALLLDHNDPQKIIARTDESILLPEEQYEKEGVVKNVVFPSGAYIQNDTLFFYYGAADTSCCLAEFPLKELFSKMRKNAPVALKLTKSVDNPILQPLKSHGWESKAVLNPAAVEDGEKVHLVYRAFSNDNTSTLGYALLENGVDVMERRIGPIFSPRYDFEDKKNPGGNSGCEDPRITEIDGKYYLCYTAYDGINPPRVALTSISKQDFLQGNFAWDTSILISSPGVDDKDACLLPEKILNKYVIFHRIQNSIVIDYIDSLSFGENKWLRSQDYIMPQKDSWDDEKIGISAPPIKTDAGWLLLYHGISSVDQNYRVGAMLLDLTNPSHVLSRTQYPILEPEFPFEREGLVSNVVFPCGMVVYGDKLYVYYGGADTVICVASIQLQKLLEYLESIKVRKFVE